MHYLNHAPYEILSKKRLNLRADDTSEPSPSQHHPSSLWDSLDRLYPYFNTAALVKRFFKLYERFIAREKTEGMMKPANESDSPTDLFYGTYKVVPNT